MAHLSRREFLVLAGGAAVAGACGSGGGDSTTTIEATDGVVARRERSRVGADARVVRAAVVAGPVQLDLAGRDTTQRPVGPGDTFTYRFAVPDPAPTSSIRTPGCSSIAPCTPPWS